MRQYAFLLLAVLVCAGCTAVSTGQASVDGDKCRVIILTDIENEPDDAESLVRLLLYSNRIDICGLVATTSTHLRDRVAPETIHREIDAYGKVRGCLLLHESGYPRAAYLHSVVKSGLPRYGMRGVGEGMDSEGSDWIIRELKKDDPRPLWISVWGGVNTLAQALWKMNDTLPQAAMEKYISKLRVYTISDQDDSGPWIRSTFPGLFYIVSPGEYAVATWTGFNTTAGIAEPEKVSNGWIAANIQQGHGPLGACYPDVAYGMEGDTPSFIGLIPNGLNDMEHPDWGGWGGRYELYTPELLYMQCGDSTKKVFTGGIPAAAETRPVWTNAEDTWTPWVANDFGVAVRPAEYSSKGFTETIYRWRSAVQNDFAARMDWCVSTFDEANHPPVPSVKAFTSCPAYSVDNFRMEPIEDLTVRSGQIIMLDADGSSDPDGDHLSYLWYQYPEAGSYKGKVDIWGAPDIRHVKLQAPEVSGPETVHIILEVTDKGTPALTRYARVVLNVMP